MIWVNLPSTCADLRLTFPLLALFDDGFIDHLFEVVEQTRDHPDDDFNYAVIKFIVSAIYLRTDIWTHYSCSSPSMSSLCSQPYPKPLV